LGYYKTYPAKIEYKLKNPDNLKIHIENVFYNNVKDKIVVQFEAIEDFSLDEKPFEKQIATNLKVTSSWGFRKSEDNNWKISHIIVEKIN
jgi:hypothetical protein